MTKIKTKAKKAVNPRGKGIAPSNPTPAQSPKPSMIQRGGSTAATALSSKKRSRVGRPKGTHSTVIYPWGAWFTKAIFTLHRGVDYYCRSNSMQLMVRERAKERGVKVSIESDPDGQWMTIRVTKPIVS